MINRAFKPHRFWKPVRFLVIIFWLYFIGLPAPLMAQSPTPDPRFGLVQTYDDFEAATESGTGFTRVNFYWDIIQPNSAEDWYPANVPDPLIEADLAAGREVVGLIVRTPAWARDPHSPRNGSAPTAKDVPDMTAWGKFVRRLAEQYQGRIHRWIIWNEPDVWDDTHVGSTWNGSEQDYVALLKTAYLNIKAVNPQNQVYLTGLTYFWDLQYSREQYLSRLLAIITADPTAPTHNFYFDGLITHLYFKPYLIFDIFREIQTMLTVYGLADKPIWLAETNAPPSDDPLEPPLRDPIFMVTQAEQNAYIIQIHALAFAAGIERVQVYKLYNSAAHPEDISPFGLLRGDKSRRPAFMAYQTVTRYLAGFKKVALWQQNEVTAVIFERENGLTTVLWNRGTMPQQVKVKANGAMGQLVNEIGQAEQITAENGAYTLILPPAACRSGECFIGGAPRLVVEDKITARLDISVTYQVVDNPPSEIKNLPDIFLFQPFSAKRRLLAFGISVAIVAGTILLGLALILSPLSHLARLR